MVQACSDAYPHTALEVSQATAHVSEADGLGWGGAVAPPRRRRVVAAGNGGQLDGIRPWGCLRQQADFLAGALHPVVQQLMALINWLLTVLWTCEMRFLLTCSLADTRYTLQIRGSCGSWLHTA